DDSVQAATDNQIYKPWIELSAEEQKRSARAMEIYAAMVSNVDHQVGRLVAHLKEIGAYDNTIFLYTHDNGGKPQPRTTYDGNTPKFFAQFDDSYENMGRPGSYVSYGAGWAEAGSTPFSYYKSTTGEGGIRVPLIVSGPGIAGSGERVSSGNAHVADITPTIIDWAGIEKPEERHGQTLMPFYGRSMAAFLDGSEAQLRTPEEPIAFELNANKMLLKGKYKIRKLGGPEVRFVGPEWMLFDIEADPAEQTDLAAEQPEKLAELVALFDEYADSVGLIEKDRSYPTLFLRQTWSVRDGRFSENPMAPREPQH
ncbi:MAG: sulfatase-like hydrolase/transferase, partial [Rhodoblastus sp.]